MNWEYTDIQSSFLAFTALKSDSLRILIITPFLPLLYVSDLILINVTPFVQDDFLLALIYIVQNFYTYIVIV